MSQPPPADDHEGAASRPATPPPDQPESEPSAEHSEEADQTQRVEVTPRAERHVSEPDPNADVTQRVELPTHTTGAGTSASAVDTGQAPVGGPAAAAGRTETDDSLTLTHDTPRDSGVAA